MQMLTCENDFDRNLYDTWNIVIRKRILMCSKFSPISQCATTREKKGIEEGTFSLQLLLRAPQVMSGGRYRQTDSTEFHKRVAWAAPMAYHPHQSEHTLINAIEKKSLDIHMQVLLWPEKMACVYPKLACHYTLKGLNQSDILLDYNWVYDT